MADNTNLPSVEHVKELGRQGRFGSQPSPPKVRSISNELRAIRHSLSNAELAASLEFNADDNRSETAKAVMHEAARRLRGEPEMVPAENPPNPPALKAYAIPEVT